MRIDYRGHNAWVAKLLGQLSVAIAENNRQRIEELASVVLIRVPNHGADSAGFGMNETDLRFHLNRLEARLYGDDEREGLANFLDRKEGLLERLSGKLRDLNRKAARGQDVGEAKDILSEDILKLKEQVEGIRDKVYPVLTVYSVLETEAKKRGIQPRQVETAPEMVPTATAKTTTVSA